jgi:hypothetical protein
MVMLGNEPGTNSPGIGGTLSLARTLAARIDTLPRDGLSHELRLVRALTLDVVDILARLDDGSDPHAR